MVVAHRQIGMMILPVRDIRHRVDERHDAEQRAYLAGQGIEPGDQPYYAPAERLAGDAVNPANAAAAADEWARREAKIEIARFQRVLVGAKRRIVGRFGNREAGGQRTVE